MSKKSIYYDRLYLLRDGKYAEFQSKLTPGIPFESFIGVRVPDVRKLAKEIVREGGYSVFLSDLPHFYYDENMLHGLIVSSIKDFDACLAETERFLPYVDNWAVCDIMSPKVFAKNKARLLAEIKKWAASDHVYTCRFGIEMLMSHFLDDDFRAEYLEIPAAVISEEYYVRMMVAWFFATALAKKWDETVVYLIENRLETWTHNKTIQKAIESFRITDEQKIFLRALKR